MSLFQKLGEMPYLPFNIRNGAIGRFAPSPTGKLHLGGLRSFILNHGLCKKVLLRIDDTDQSRCKTRYIDDIYSGLQKTAFALWRRTERMGCQSDFTDSYSRYLSYLLTNDLAYYAWDSKEELELLRKDNPGFQYFKDQFPTKEKQIKNKVVRLNSKKALERLDSSFVEMSSFFDVAKKEYRINMIESLDDFILMKSDGSYSYFLASIVNDLEANCNLIIRGEEWLPSWNKTLLLQKIFDREKIIRYMHLPLILNPDGSKMSKRNLQVNLSVTDLIAEGYEPSAIFNYAAWLAFPKLTDQIFDDLHFIQYIKPDLSYEDVVQKPVRFDRNILNHIQKAHVSKALNSVDFLVTLKQKLISTKTNLLDYDREELGAFSQKLLEKTKANTSSELIQKVFDGLNLSFYSVDNIKNLHEDIQKTIFAFLDLLISQKEQDPKIYSFEIIKSFSDEKKVSVMKLLKSLRTLFCDDRDGIPITTILDHTDLERLKEIKASFLDLNK